MIWNTRSGVFLGKSDLKICNKFIAEHPCRGVISKKLFCNFIEITLQHGCSPVNLLHIFRTTFPKKLLDSYFSMMLKISILWLYNITFLRIRVHCNKNYFLLMQMFSSDFGCKSSEGLQFKNEELYQKEATATVFFREFW